MKSSAVRIPSSSLGKAVSCLILLIFSLVPFYKPLLHKIFKQFSLSIIPSDIAIPAYFSTKIAFYLSDLFLVLLLFFILYFKRARLSEYLWSGPSKYLTLLFLTALLSLSISSTSHYLLMYTRFLEVALVAVLFNSIKIAFDAKTIATFLKCLAWLIFVLALFESAIALSQYFSQDRVGFKFLGEPNRTHFSFQMPRWEISLFDILFHIQRKSDVLLRSTGTFPHPNIYGGFQFCALLTTFYLYLIQAKKTYKGLILFGILLQMLALTLTFSRAAIIALFISTLLYFILQLRTLEKRISVAALTLTLLLSTITCLTMFYPQIVTRGGLINYNQLVQGADSERLLYQNIAFDMIQERPLLGVGLNNFQIESHRFFPMDRILPSKVHNIYLLIAAETGLVGISFFLLFLFFILKSALRNLTSPHTLFLFSVFTGLLFIGACDFYFISTPHGRILFFGAAALLFASSKGNPILEPRSV